MATDAVSQREAKILGIIETAAHSHDVAAQCDHTDGVVYALAVGASLLWRLRRATAIETGLRGRFQFIVRKDMKLSWPRAETATDFISMATDPDLAVATKGAIHAFTKAFESPELVAQQKKINVIVVVAAVKRGLRKKRRSSMGSGVRSSQRAKATSESITEASQTIE